MLQLILATAFFLGIHLCISGTGLRNKLTYRLGEGGYQVLFSLLSIGGLLWLILAYNQSPTRLLWSQPAGAGYISSILVLIAFIFAVNGVLTPNPTSVAGGRLLKRPDAARGIVRITRHPFLWGVALWAATHMVFNGDTASLIFFGGFLVLSLLGTRSIDAKRQRLYGEAWSAFAAKTSNLPFAAIVRGRNKLQLGEFGLRRLAGTLILYIAVLLAHRWLFGVSPFSGG